MPDIRMLQHLRGGSRRLLEVAREEEGARVRSASAREDLVGAGPRELDRAAAVEHRPADATVDRARTNHLTQISTYRVGLTVLLTLRPIGELHEPALLDRALSGEHRGHRGGRRQLRVLEETVVRQRANPAKKRAAVAAPDQRQVVVDEHLGDELVVAGSRRMPERFHGQSVRSEPFGGSALDRRRGGRLG